MAKISETLWRNRSIWWWRVVLKGQGDSWVMNILIYIQLRAKEVLEKHHVTKTVMMSNYIGLLLEFKRNKDWRFATVHLTGFLS